MERSDPLGPEFYAPLKVAEILLEASFYVAGALSVAVLLIDRAATPLLYDIALTTFTLLVIVLFAGGVLVRTYFAARAHAKRIADFVSNVFSVSLLTNPSSGYHNTPGADPYVRMGAAVLENALFTEAIAQRMLVFERSRIGLYLVIWVWAVFFRSTDLNLVAVAAQVLFSEQLVSRWIRMEWLRSKVERIYDDTYQLFGSTTDRKTAEFRARVVEAIVRYETTKAQAGLSMSSRVFEHMNGTLTDKWSSLAGQLRLDQPQPRKRSP